MRLLREFSRRALLVALPLLLGAACSRPAPEQNAAAGIPPMPKEIVDLTPTIGVDAPLKAVGHRFLKDFGYKDSTRFEHMVADTPFYAADSYLTVFNHVGPHHDPPSHVIKGAKSTDQIPLDRFYGKARIIDFRAKPKDQPLTVADFQNKGIQAGDIVIAFVGYTPPIADSLPSYAYLSGDAAEWLAKLPIKAFGTDMPSLGGIRHYYELSAQHVRGSDKFFPEHYAFLSREIPNIEGLVNLEPLVGKENVVFVGFPLKIKDGNGGPMRAAALVY